MLDVKYIECFERDQRLSKKSSSVLLKASEASIFDRWRAEGKTTKQAASKLNLSVKTVETHRQHIMDKLNIHTVAELTKYAIREGLTSLES